MARDDQGRRAGRNFASLRATFSRSTVSVNEVPPKENVKKKVLEEIPPVPKTKLSERRQSKYTLFDLFSKPKVHTARGYHESGLEVLPEQPPSPKSVPVKHEGPKKPIERVEPVPVQIPNPPRIESAKATTIEQPRVIEYWDAPPLFQAYPQSTRHGTLQCPLVPIDTLVRAQNLRRQAGFLGSSTSLPSVRENTDGLFAQEAGNFVAKRHSVVNEAPELVDKIFVLVTAGRLVQYAGDGNYDRMPESVFQLGEKSAAFACDLIPGKHWVVQVVQQMNTDVGGGQINKSRSILSRLRNPAAGRKSTTSVLLVFSSAEDMDAWLKAIKSAIERLGGAKKKDDGEDQTSVTKNTAKAPDEQLSYPYQISRPASMISTATSIHRSRSASSFSQPRSPRSPTEVTLSPVPNSIRLSPHDSPSNSPKDTNFPVEVQSLIGTTTNNSPMDSSIASSDQIHLERVRQGSRTSMISTRTSRTSETEHVTIATSKCSSSPSSPHAETFAEQRSSSNPEPIRTSYIAPSNVRQLSFQSVSPAEINKAETVNRTEAEHALPSGTERIGDDVLEPAPVQHPVIMLDNPRSRTSYLYSQTMPARLYTSNIPGRRNSETSEPLNKQPRPDSVVGQLPLISTRSLTRLDSVSKPRRPLSRMLPVRPSEPTSLTQAPIFGPGPAVYPRRYSSLPSGANTVMTAVGSSPRTSTPNVGTPSTTTSADSPELLSRKSTPPTHRPRMPSLPLSISSQPSPPQQAMPQARALRRPTSLQIRSDPAPFLSRRNPSVTMRSSDPVMVSNSYFAGSTPSNDFLPKTGQVRASSTAFESPFPPPFKPIPPIPTSTFQPTAGPHSPPPAAAPPIPPMNPNRSTVRTRASMPAFMLSGLPPPAPPPSMPLPSLPPSGLPPSMPLPSLPPSGLPPNMPLPSLPPSGLPSSMPLPSLSPSGLPPSVPLPSLPPSRLPPNMPLPSLPPNIPLPSLPPNIPLPPVPTHTMAS
jgi:hypothetical protein